MDNPSEERTTAELFGEYANLLWRRLWILILLACMAGGIAFFVSLQQTPIYQSSTLVMINAAPSVLSDPSNFIYTSQQLAETYANIMTTQPILDGVKGQLGLDSLSASIQVQPIQNTSLLTVTVQDTEPIRAAMIANTLVSVFAEQLKADQTVRYADSKKNLENQIATLEGQIQTTSTALNAMKDIPENQAKLLTLHNNLTQYQNSYSYALQSYAELRLAEAQSISTVIQKDPAVPNASPVKPHPFQSAILAAAVGLLLAGGIVFLIEFLDDTIRDPQEIVRKWGVPILGIITRYKTNEGSLITLKQPRSPVSEAFRALRTNLEFAAVDAPLETILITSPSPQDGKTTIAVNLACVLAQSNRRVVAVDADLRRPQLNKPFHLTNRIGLTDQLIQSQKLVRVFNTNQPIPPKEQLEGCIQDTELANLKVITSGGLPPDPSVLLGSIRMQELMVSLRDRFDCVILDTPPVLMVTDAVVLAPRVGGVIIVVKPSVTKRAGLHHVIDQLRQVNARVLGVVINNVDVKRSRYFYYRRYNSGYRDKYPKGYANQETSPTEKKKDDKARVFL